MAQDASGIVAGTLDPPSGLKTMGHIFTGEKGDFTDLTDELPKFKASSEGALDGDRL